MMWTTISQSQIPEERDGDRMLLSQEPATSTRLLRNVFEYPAHPNPAHSEVTGKFSLAGKTAVPELFPIEGSQGVIVDRRSSLRLRSWKLDEVAISQPGYACRSKWESRVERAFGNRKGLLAAGRIADFNANSQ